MLTIMTVMALGAVQPVLAAPATDAHAPHTPTGQADHSRTDHSKMDHAKMPQQGDGCCKKTADGKMECAMRDKAGTGSSHQGHDGH